MSPKNSQLPDVSSDEASFSSKDLLRLQPEPRRKIYLKSIHSMILNVGALRAKEPSKTQQESPQKHPDEPRQKRLEDEGMARIEESIEESRRQREKLRLPEIVKKPTNYYIDFFKLLFKKSVSLTGRVLFPMSLRSSDPILQRAERLLIESNVIKKKKKVRLGERKQSRQGYFPSINLTRLSRKFQAM